MDVLLQFVMDSHDYILSTQTKCLWYHEGLWVLADYNGHRQYDGLHFKNLHFMATHGEYNES